jgi:hypothetical protein
MFYDFPLYHYSYALEISVHVINADAQPSQSHSEAAALSEVSLPRPG